jgi:hypothetical protein
MFITSVSMLQTQSLLKDLLSRLHTAVSPENRITNLSVSSIDNNSTKLLNMDSYLKLHSDISSRISHTYYAVQYVTVGALINMITYLWLIWSESINDDNTYGFVVTIENIPYFLKEIVFFFYILEKVIIVIIIIVIIIIIIIRLL